MGFEDFNYELYNKYILVDPNRDDDEDKDIDGFKPASVEKNKKGQPNRNQGDENKSLPLTENQLE